MKFHWYKFLLLALIGVFVVVVTMDEPLTKVDPVKLQEEFLKAVDTNNMGKVQALLKSNPTITGKEAALSRAIQTENSEMVRLLISNNVDINVRYSETLETPLIIAVKQNTSNEIITLLLNAGADTNVSEIHGMTPLRLAVDKDNVEAVKLLLDAGANTEVFWNGMTPLMEASQEGYTAVVRLLLEVGANPNFTNISGNTPLMAAAHYGKVDVIELLLSHGANINAQNSHGFTPLHAAVNTNRSPAVRILLENGADQTLRNKQGQTALELAESLSAHEDNRRVIELLKNPPVKKEKLK